jgi:DNA primase
LLSTADRELQTIKSTLLARGVPDGLVAPYIERGRSAVSTTLLPTTWNNVTQYFSQDTLLAYQWFSYLLDEEIQSINPEDVSKLLEEIANLETELQTAELSPGLKQFLLSHLKAMQDALRQSRIAGAKPIQRAVRTVQSDCEFEGEHLSAEIKATPDKSTAKKAGEKFTNIWKKAVELSGDIEKIQKGAKTLSETAVAVISFISDKS